MIPVKTCMEIDGGELAFAAIYAAGKLPEPYGVKVKRHKRISMGKLEPDVDIDAFRAEGEAGKSSLSDIPSTLKAVEKPYIDIEKTDLEFYYKRKPIEGMDEGREVLIERPPEARFSMEIITDNKYESFNIKGEILNLLKSRDKVEPKLLEREKRDRKNLLHIGLGGYGDLNIGDKDFGKYEPDLLAYINNVQEGIILAKKVKDIKKREMMLMKVFTENGREEVFNIKKFKLV